MFSEPFTTMKLLVGQKSHLVSIQSHATLLCWSRLAESIVQRAGVRRSRRHTHHDSPGGSMYQ